MKPCHGISLLHNGKFKLDCITLDKKMGEGMRNVSTNVLMVFEDQLRISFTKQHNLPAIRALTEDKGLAEGSPG